MKNFGVETSSGRNNSDPIFFSTSVSDLLHVSYFRFASYDGIGCSVKYLPKKCDHAPEMRTFKLLNAATTFEKFESQLLCNTDSLLEISLAKNEEGPWTKLEDSLTGGSGTYSTRRLLV